jgi:hypothetical protein
MGVTAEAGIDFAIILGCPYVLGQKMVLSIIYGTQERLVVSMDALDQTRDLLYLTWLAPSC